jgi:quinol monooxygenase YgiN
MRLSCARP